MFLTLTSTFLGLLLVMAENTDHVTAKMTSFASSHTPDYYTFGYEMDDGTLHKEEGRLVDGVWVIASQFSCSSDDSPIQSFSFVGNKCGFNSLDTTRIGLNEKLGDAFKESVEAHAKSFQLRNVVPFSNDTNVPLKIGLPIPLNQLKSLKLINETANDTKTTAKSDISSHIPVVNSSEESNTTVDSINETHSKPLNLGTLHKDNINNKPNVYIEIGSPESIKQKTEKYVQLKQDTQNQPADNTSTRPKTNEIVTEDKNIINSSEIVSIKTESEKRQVGEGQGNSSHKHPIIKRIQITRHPDVNMPMANTSELGQLFTDDQQTGNNRSSNFQVFFNSARNMTVDSESRNFFVSSDDVDKDIFYNNSRSFLEALLKTDNVPYSIITEAIPNSSTITPGSHVTALPKVKVEGSL